MVFPKGVPQKRLDLYGINKESMRLARKFWYAVVPQFDGITQKFYNRLQANPDTARYLSSPRMIERLRAAQKVHWQDLFTGEFDASYVARVTVAAEAHLRIRLPNYHYMAAYAFFLNELTAHAQRLFASDMDEAVHIVGAINMLVMLDMDVTTSIYMQRMMHLSAAKAAAPAQEKA